MPSYTYDDKTESQDSISSKKMFVVGATAVALVLPLFYYYNYKYEGKSWFFKEKEE